MNWMRAGFMACSRPNSPCSSHHCDESRLKCSISDACTDDGPASLPSPDRAGESSRTLDVDANDRTAALHGLNRKKQKASQRTVHAPQGGKEGPETHWQTWARARASERTLVLPSMFCSQKLFSKGGRKVQKKRHTGEQAKRATRRGATSKGMRTSVVSIGFCLFLRGLQRGSEARCSGGVRYQSKGG